MKSQPLVRLGFGSLLRLRLFSGLERLSDLKGNTTAGALKLSAPPQPEPALWVYVTTIGELNAIGPLLRPLVQRLSKLRLVLITNHGHYEASYRTQYPQAEVCVTLGHGHDAQVLASHFPPRLLVVGEIPCWPSDAPCRFSVAFVAEAKRHGAAAAIVNGWLYGDPPSCRMDAIERRLLGATYLQAFDVICMQMSEGRDAVLREGAQASRVHVTGNLKFDALGGGDWSPDRAKSPALLRSLQDSGRAVLVAGCVTNADEQHQVIEAFVQLRAAHPDALLVVAPRHPEVRERVDALAARMREAGLDPVHRSSLNDGTVPTTAPSLILDTMGELRDFYAAATIAHVGVDHNVLEPLAFGRPVTVSEGWNSRYPSFPVYRVLMASGALLSASDATGLATHWRSLLGTQPRAPSSRGPSAAVQAEAGAVRRHFDALGPILALAQH